MSLSERLRQVVDALPLGPGMRVLEIGGAPGAAAREVASRTAHVLVLDRSAAGISKTEQACTDLIAAGRLSVLCAPVESFSLPDGIEPFDLAFACRVGALDGRHPDLYEPALRCISGALVPNGRLFVDTREVKLGA